MSVGMLARTHGAALQLPIKPRSLYFGLRANKILTQCLRQRSWSHLSPSQYRCPPGNYGTSDHKSQSGSDVLRRSP
eukprot:3146685-Rhodomonas_salina.3